MKKRQLIFWIAFILVIVFIFSIGTILELRKEVHSVAPQTTLIAVALNLAVFFLGIHIPIRQKQYQVIRIIICVIGIGGAVLSAIATIILTVA